MNVPRQFVLALDQSTSSSKAILFDELGAIVDQEKLHHRQIYPHPSWVEQDPMELLANSTLVLRRILDKGHVSTSDHVSVAITNQRETIIGWDKNSGRPVYNAIVWQCRRTADFCEHLKKIGLEQMIHERTGLVPDPYFSASKIKWVLDNVEGVRSRAEIGEILFGTVDTWLIWNLTGGKSHVTDVTNASRTMLFNLQTMSWDPDLLRLFSVPEAILPTVLASDGDFGRIPPTSTLPYQLSIKAVMGDSQASLFGHGCYQPGDTKATFGTGTSILINIGNKPEIYDAGIVTSPAWSTRDETVFALECVLHTTGDILNWMKDCMRLIQDFDEVDDLAKSIQDNQGVYFIPALVGLGFPYWNADVRASIIGLSRGTQKEHVVRAALESIVYQIKDAIDYLLLCTGLNITKLFVDGGGSKSDFLMQFQADMLNLPIQRATNENVSALGVGFMAGVASGIWSKAEIRTFNTYQAFNPMFADTRRQQCYKGWTEAISTALGSSSQAVSTRASIT